MSEWAKYGFPDPGLMLEQHPMEGLCRALYERYACVFPNDYPPADTMAIDPVPVMTETGRLNVRGWESLDNAIRRILPYYTNHTDPKEPLWTWDTLLAAALRKGELRRIIPDTPCLEPTPSLIWASQRYRMINLLQRPKIDIPYHTIVIEGHVHTGIPSSILEAMETAMSQGTETNGRSLDVYINGIYGPDHGWREGSYCINLTCCSKAFVSPAELPKEYSATKCHLSFTAVNTNPDCPFNNFGTGLTEGRNTFTANEDGVFFENSSRLSPPDTPTPGRQTYGGFRCTDIACYVAFEPDFLFLDKTGEP